MTYGKAISFIKDEIESMVGALPEDYALHLADLQHQDSHSLNWDVKTSELMVCDGNVNLVRIQVKDAKRAIAMLGNEFLATRSTGIHSSAVIEEGASIGKNCYIGPHAVVKSCAALGDNVRIEAGAVIGNDGFGFVRDANGDWIRFPQIGRVIIGDGVEIGANTTIDRGALSDTLIARDVKINANVHIAHNVTIGEHTVITANVNISGSSKIGANVWVAPGAILRDHSIVEDSATVGMGAVVVKDIPRNEVWCGNPARRLRKNEP